MQFPPMSDHHSHAPLASFDTDISSSSSSSCELTILTILSPIPSQTNDLPSFSHLPRSSETRPIKSGQGYLEHQPNLTRDSPIHSIPLLGPAPSIKISCVSKSNHRRLVVLFTLKVNLILDGLQLGVTVLFKYYTAEFRSHVSVTAWVASIFLAMPHLLGPFSSYMVNRFGCRTMTIVGTLLVAGGVGFSSLSSGLPVILLLYSVIGGIGTSFVDVSSNTVLAQHFDKGLSFASGISVCGGGIGVLLLVPLTEFLLEKYGWRRTNQICAGIYLLMIPCGLFFGPPENSNASGELLSVAVDTETTEPQESWYVRLGMHFKEAILESFEPLKYPGFQIFLLSNFILFFFYDLPFIFHPTEISKPSWVISMIGVVNAIGQVFLGWLGDRERVNCEVVYAYSITLSGLTVAVMPIIDNNVLIFIDAGLFGLMVGSNYALTNIIIKTQLKVYLQEKRINLKGKTFEKVLEEKITTAYGLLMFIQGVASLLGPPLAGWIKEVNGTSNVTFYIAGVAITISGLLMFTFPFYNHFNKKPAATVVELSEAGTRSELAAMQHTPSNEDMNQNVMEQNL